MESNADQLEALKTKVNQLRRILTDRRCARGYLNLFDEFFNEMEFELALHAVCDYLIDANTPLPEAVVIEQVEDLHRTMQIEDDCLDQIRQKFAWPTPSEGHGKPPADEGHG